MMKIRLICLGLFFHSFLSHTYAQHFTCNSLEGYNTKDLTSASQWHFTYDQCLGNLAADCTFYMSFCQTASACFNEYSACENSTGASNVTVIGAYTATVFSLDDSIPNGFAANFPRGPEQNISNTTYCQPSLKVKFNCNLKSTWTVPLTNASAAAPDPTNVDIDPNDPCLTIVTFDYAGACKNGIQPKDDKLSGGAIFLIILFSALFVYLLVGVLYNAFKEHKSGIDLIPNARFWIRVLLNAIEGLRTVLSCCLGSSQPSRATYDSVG